MASEISASLAGVISALDPTKIPDKLHCPHCDGFLLNGYKLSCCDQSICETCHPKLSDRCLICEHEPFTPELCKPNVGLRKTAKAFLKTQEKKIADERVKSQAVATPAEEPEPVAQQEDVVLDESGGPVPVTEAEDVQPDGPAGSSIEEYAADDPRSSPEIVTDSGPIGAANRESGAAAEMAKRESPILREASANEQFTPELNLRSSIIAAESSKDSMNGIGAEMNLNGFPNLLSMNAGVNIMDPNQMMQYMNANGMSGFSTLMGMPNMSMNQMPQGMFGGFGGPGMGMSGMNGMNMGMNFNPNAGMFGSGWNGQNNNMWNGPQSNNPNAFSNGIGGDFGSNSGYGYNMSQSANFQQQQQHPHGDFGYYGRGPGRGRGRGRGGFNRSRSSFNNFSQANQPHFQNAHEQQQYEIQNMQAQMLNDQPSTPKTGDQKSDSKQDETNEEQPVDDDEFAPGGQEDVQEALGADYHRSQIDESKEDSAADTMIVESIEQPEQTDSGTDAVDLTPAVDIQPVNVEAASVQSPKPDEDKVDVSVDLSNKSSTQDEPKTSMAPPSAPSGPSNHYREPEDFGFRARGHNKFPSRSRGSLSGMNGSPVSPMKAPSQASPVSPAEPKGVGVVGAPTGPRAMREPPATKSARPLSGSLSNTGGFKIMGRASMASQDSEKRDSHRSRSNTPARSGENHVSEPRSASRQQSRHSGHENSRDDAEPNDDYDRDYDRDRKRSKKTRKDDRDDYEMQDGDRRHSRSRTPSDRKSSHRSRRDKDRDRDRDHHTSSRKRTSSHSRHQTNGDKSHELDDYGNATSRDPIESESRSSHRGHRSGKSSKHDDRDREERHRDRDRVRKRSRHDRDHDDDVADDDDESSRHRSRRHKREHRDESTTNGNGAGKGSHRSSKAATPVESEKDRDKEKDPHTLEREARNRERMAKEMQRREKVRQDDRGGGSAAGSKRRDGRISGGRRVSYKYEEDLQSSMVETERERSSWR